ncbi:MAG: OsmC family protein [Gammaproteobacteria bacterium]
MQNFPHHYKVAAAADPDGEVSLKCEGLETIASVAPVEFDGPGDKWSPETLLTAAVADCFILTFRAIARASKLEWTSLECEVEGTLDRREHVTLFTEFTLQATLAVPPGTDEERAHHLLEKAEAGCLVTNSLSAEIHLNAKVSKAA